ncbi:MAG: hypothetical protein ACRD82_18355, partial [Blastocatellia bacterium]
SIKSNLDELEKLLKWVNSHCFYEDYVYRFYHQSFKVYQLQELTRKIADLLLSIAPEGKGFCHYFQELIQAGAGEKVFEMDHNLEWTTHTRPFVEAFFHARYFLEMAVKYGQSLDEVPKYMPSGLAALFCLYDIN